MPAGLNGMAHQDREERNKHENELKRILSSSEKRGLILRVIGSLAFQIHCQKFGYLHEAMGCSYTDIDFASCRRDVTALKSMMLDLGNQENREVYIISGGDRSIFINDQVGIYVDIFYDNLDFCHQISWTGRLEVDSPTIPLADMLLEKMQIVEINEKDVINTIMLLLEHDIAEEDKETINNQWSMDCRAVQQRLGSMANDNDEPKKISSCYPRIMSRLMEGKRNVLL